MTRPRTRLAARLRGTAPAFAIVLSLCTVPAPPTPDPNLFPANYKALIVTFLSVDLPDPTNIRGAFISEPALTPVGGVQRWTACVRYNPRAARRYTGSEDRLAIFLGGQLAQLIPATPDQCAKAPYKPFPELEKICKGERCN